jgi:hypothetical protein
MRAYNRLDANPKIASCRLAPIRGPLSFLHSRYWPAAGDFTLGVARVLLLVVGAVVPDVAELFVLLGRPELGLADMPLSEFVMPDVP